MADDREFEPRLGRTRSSGGGRGKSYLQRVLRAATLASPSRAGTSKFQGSRIARGFGTGKVLAGRDRLAAFRTRRAIIKTRIVKMRGAGAKAASLHLRYIQRDGVTRDGEAGQLYSRDSDSADAKAFQERGAGDRHQFRFIVSAEDAGEYADLKPFVRKLMARMEADLGTDLDWVAVDHHNTGHPHTHIVLHGHDDLSKDLIIARDYVAHGMRERAAEIVTLDLGPRSDLEIEGRFARQVAQERLTDLDRAMRRAAGETGVLSLTTATAGTAHHHWAGRLQTLARMGLAEEIEPARWRLSVDLEDTLKVMGMRGDIIALMNRELSAKSRARGLGELAVWDAGSDPVAGQVVSRGLSDTRDDTHFLVVDGVDGKVHYAEVPATLENAVAPGAIVRLRAGAGAERAVDRTVATIAAKHGSYSAALHQGYDPKASPEFIAAHIRRLEAMRRLGNLAERKPDGSWVIAKDHVARGASFDAQRTGAKVELLSPVSLENLTARRARTWLDQELMAETRTPLSETGFGHEARQALRARRAWLVEQGLAREETARVIYPRDLLTTLQAQEVAQAGADLAATLGKRYSAAADGRIAGVVREPLHLVSGKFSVIERARDFTLVPWRPVLERQIGKPVAGIMRGDTVSWTLGRTRGPSVS